MSSKNTIIQNNHIKKNKLKEIDELDELDKLDELDTISNVIISKTPNKPKNIITNTSIKSKLIVTNSDPYDNLDTIQDSFESLPKNYGNKWSDDDKQQLIDFLKQNKNKEIDYLQIANKLGRSEGGVKGEIKKMIIKRYLNGEEPEILAKELNVQYKFVKILIKSYLENDIDADIKNLEKENKFLKLKMENIELRKTMFNSNNK